MQDSFKTRAAIWAWPAALASAIALMSSFSTKDSGLDVNIPHSDKLIHFLIFGLLATAVLRALPRKIGFWRAVIAVIAVALFGALDEVHQAFTPGRHPSLADWLADVCGALAASHIYLHWKIYRRLLETPLRLRKTGRPA